MSRDNQKARRRGNRRIRRREEHERSILALNAGDNTPDGEERLSRKNAYGNADPTAYYALYNIDNPKRPRYGF